MIVAVDIGASTTKGVVLSGSRIVHRYLVQTTDALYSASETLEDLFTKVGSRNRIDQITVSGGGSHKIGGSLLGLPVKKVDEIQAIGLGGLILTNKRKSLVVSVGTGTAMVAAYDGGKQIVHVGGTGIGGGTILGLSKRMLGIDNYAVLESMASRGDPDKVDLTVADIVGGPIGIIPANATASNFGKLTNDASEEDVAAGIFSMVSQTVGVVTSMAAKAYDLMDDTILVGLLVKSKIVSKTIAKTTKLFGLKVHIPKDCEFSTAVGAASYISLFE